jgi:hypothetical protein
MSARRIAASDVQHVCRTSFVTLIHTDTKDVTWRVEGKNIDGDRITVIVVVYEYKLSIKVVTAF